MRSWLLLLLAACGGTDDSGDALPVAACDGDDGAAVQLTIAPYVQQVTATGAFVMWETDVGTGSRVDLGTDEALGEVACGGLVPVLPGGDPADADTQVHLVELTGLQPDTVYRYQARTGATASDVQHFRTAPEGTESAFSLVAMSDSQRDDAHPQKFAEIVQDGVFATLDADVADELAFALFPGDLVDNGWQLSDWQDDFFGQGAELFASVPVYPTPGNHEGGSPHYFRYFHLPDNGLDEHTYWFDRGNLRVVSLDSNADGDPQLAWLDEVLADTCDRDEIDFVFAQLHHPYLSELWVPGESRFTGEVVARFEAFSTSCGKPSIHFFGHTHGYSRGQSQGHQHLWVNVAGAGGALDRWGATEQADYEEFSVSQDEYGFVRVDVEAGDQPRFVLRRYSLGTPESPIDTEVTDHIEVRRDNTPPAAPAGLSAGGACEGGPIFATAPFSDADGDAHQATRWQLAASCDRFDTPLVERWRQDRNEYGGVDLQAGDDLTDEAFPELSAGQDVCWRVRHRDAGLAWSDWSGPLAVTIPACN